LEEIVEWNNNYKTTIWATPSTSTPQHDDDDDD